MPRPSFFRFLLTANAIQVHVLCIVLIVVLSISLWTGEAQPDYKWGLLFTIIFYPIILGLMWWFDRLNEQASIEHINESLTAPEKLLQKRRWWRCGSLVCLVTAAAWLIYLGNHGWRLDFLPSQYFGYFLFALAALGTAGVNIWYGGPLDLRIDPSSPVPGSQNNLKR